MKVLAEKMDLDVADVIMYALDNGKHDIHISCYEGNVHVNIFPIKEDKEPIVTKDNAKKPDPKADVKDCGNCKHQKHKGSIYALSPCYECISSVKNGIVGEPSGWRPKEA